jgi:hypothetical protein
MLPAGTAAGCGRYIVRYRESFVLAHVMCVVMQYAPTVPLLSEAALVNLIGMVLLHGRHCERGDLMMLLSNRRKSAGGALSSDQVSFPVQTK